MNFSFFCFKQPTKDYKRLAPNQPCGLRHAGYIITVQDVIRVRDSKEKIEFNSLSRIQIMSRLN
jgi:hypothetical protein